MMNCSCPDQGHDLDTPEGALGHILSLGDLAAVPANARDAYRQLVVTCLAAIAPIPTAAMAMAAGCFDEGALAVDNARRGLRILASRIERIEQTGRLQQTMQWMREAGGKSRG